MTSRTTPSIFLDNCDIYSRLEVSISVIEKLKRKIDEQTLTIDEQTLTIDEQKKINALLLEELLICKEKH